MLEKSPSYYKKLSLEQLYSKVKAIRGEFPSEKRNVITYSRNFTLSLSNYCRNQCKYCYYNHRIPKSSENENIVLLDQKKLKSQIRKGKEFNCKEALIISGEQPDTFSEVVQRLSQMGFKSYIEYVENICKYSLNNSILPHVNIGLLSYSELERLKKVNASMGLMLESSSNILLKKGGVHEFSPGKKPEIRIEHIKNAGILKIPFTTGLLLGIGERFEDRVKDLFLIKQIHENYGHIQEVIIQNFEYKKGIPYHPVKMISMKEMLKITGIARLIFKNDIAIQVPPNLIQGYERQFLKIGIDDFGGVSPFSQDYINPDKEWPNIKRLENICEENGFILNERLPIYEKFINNPNFCPEKVKKVIKALKI
ncbi:MAG: 7,8-didemethyl-8-hydroxy-5-deazariboflavin synthase subunit CofG [Promethearchaeota archaeon]|nr:MAG: 7,8-didemethyl-8-hydroxy-5-deazariboflavin synthase subunit CofG [Candidatus Lokiarchaeota archaeon]